MDNMYIKQLEPRKNIELYNIHLKFQHTPVHKKRSIGYK